MCHYVGFLQIGSHIYIEVAPENVIDFHAYVAVMLYAFHKCCRCFKIICSQCLCKK